MKKCLLTTALLAMLVFPNLAPAQKGGGFTGPNDSQVTVAEALKLPDETRVTLVGKIQKQLAHEKYQFSDATGSITLDIDDKRWRGLTIGPDDTVRVSGEIDKDSDSLEFDVRRISKM